MLAWRRCSPLLIAFGNTLAVSSADIACGGLATENQGKDSGLVDSAARDGRAEAQVEAASNPCIITASSYDVSCHVDSDCAAVWFGDVCTAGACGGCEPNGSINVSATNAYAHDIAAVIDVRVACPCPPPLDLACCDHGTCVFQSHCGG